MAAHNRLRVTSQCLQCFNSLFRPDVPRLASPFQIQVRGKKKLPKSPPLVHARLIEDVPRYGPKGVILVVPAGRMRNLWYPHKKAIYVTASELKSVEHEVVGRDRMFMPLSMNEEDELLDSVAREAAQITLLSAKRTRDILDTTIPTYIEFYRQPIEADPEHNKNVPQAIYGSVATTDIVTSIKAMLAAKAREESFGDAGRVVLNPEDVKIIRAEVQTTDTESDRVKVLGDFDIEISPRGEEALKRRIRIIPQGMEARVI